MKVDFHCHTNASDGELTPFALIDRAREKEITHLAITDHDTTLGYEQVRDYACQKAIHLIPGSEVSCQWEGHTLHIVGLGMDVSNADLQAGLKLNRIKRWQRAFAINDKAKRKNIPGLLDALLPEIGDGMIGRHHFAKVLVRDHQIKNVQKAFDKYLKKGRPLYAEVNWPQLATVLQWIQGAGGLAVLAHPHIYRLSGNKMNRLLTEFKAQGGAGIEVVNQPRVCSEQFTMAERAKRFDLLASVGSDFHSTEHVWRDLGWLSPMPAGLTPIWEHLPPDPFESSRFEP